MPDTHAPDIVGHLPDNTLPGTVLGRDLPRPEGRGKVTGEARYASDVAVRNPAYAVLVTSTIARGRVRGMDLADALAVPGALDVLWHGNAATESRQIPPTKGGGASVTTLQSDRVWHEGQIIALVLADSYEAAREAAHRVRVDYDAEPPAAGLDAPGAEEQEVRAVDPSHHDPEVGDARTALAIAPVQVDALYETPTQHHNPIELFTTTCEWHGDRLTIHEPSQFLVGLAGTVARQIGVEPDQVRAVSRLVGGGFGSKGAATSRTSWVAVAARRLNRPVKLVSTREQGFTIATHRAETRQRVRLGAERDGQLVALLHEGWEVSSRPSNYTVGGTLTTARMYGCPNVWTRVHVVHADRPTPGFMRAPPDLPYGFALESAMDELAWALDMDPIALRRRNDADHEPINGLPFTSRGMMRCFDAAAERFGWADRNPRPGDARDGDWLLGTGCAAAYYPAKIGPAFSRVTARADGTALVEMSAQEIGQGATGVIALVAADRLGLEPERVEVVLGDSALPPAGLAAGSSHTASIANAVALACEEIRARLARAAVTANHGALAGADPGALVLRGGALRAPDGREEDFARAMARLGDSVRVEAGNHPRDLPADSLDKLRQGQMAMSGGFDMPDRIGYGFGAQFAAVRVNRWTGEVRVPRLLGAFAAGRIVNRRTAHSQLVSGMIWGMGSALLEGTEIDRRTARYTNDNLAEYLIAVNADVPEVEAIMLPEDDATVNPLGIKGVGELGAVGVNAAIANAVFHATGRRLRRLPIRAEDLL